jgi:alpha-D-xyloside xylohydrolase
MMSGFGFWSHDIGGFESTSTPDVYKRWAAFGLLSSHSRLHGSTSYRVPWAYDEEAVDVVRFFTKLKASIMPYLYKTAIETSQTGVPTMRSMVLEFTEDRTCHYLDRQYMLGDSILVSPVFNEDSTAEYYLPAGSWTNYFTGEKIEGSRWFTEKHGYLSIPFMVRENSIVAIGACDDKADYDYADGVQLKVYELKEGKEASTVVYGMDGANELEITVIKNNGQITIKANAKKAYSIRLVNVILTEASNASITVDGNDTIITPNNNTSEIICK